MIMIKATINKTDKVEIMHPPPVTAFPIFLCRPGLVIGIPVFLEMLCLAFVTPVARFQEKPPLFAIRLPPLGWRMTNRAWLISLCFSLRQRYRYFALFEISAAPNMVF